MVQTHKKRQQNETLLSKSNESTVDFDKAYNNHNTQIENEPSGTCQKFGFCDMNPLIYVDSSQVNLKTL